MLLTQLVDPAAGSEVVALASVADRKVAHITLSNYILLV
jgi:hypothetical protein